MAEVQTRPSASRGRSSARGRGGFSSRGGGRHVAKQSRADTDLPPDASLDEQGELGQLKKHYRTDLSTLKELFPDWTDDDLVFALQETDGDIQSTIERITEGNVSKFADVKKKTREKSRSKPAADQSHAVEGDTRAASSTRGRARGGLEAGRGGRGRASERGRGATRGRRGAPGAPTNGTRSASAADPAATAAAVAAADAPPGWDAPVDTPSTEPAWDQSATPAADTTPGAWSSAAAAEPVAAATTSETQRSSLIPQGSTKSWASMLAKPKAPPAVPKAAAAPTSTAAESGLRPKGPTTAVSDEHHFGKNAQTPFTGQEAGAVASVIEDKAASNVPHSTAELAPPQDPLTERNLEHLPDSSAPVTTETVASTRDPRSAIGSATPSFAGSQQAPIGRPTLGGFQASAQKAAGFGGGRSLSFQRLQQQQDPVVMPRDHAVDRAAVQFGQLGLSEDGKPLDVDDEREDAETRAQPPQQSPSQPRASLPPAPRQHPASSETPTQDGLPTPKQAPGLPMPSQQHVPGVAPSSQPYSSQDARFESGGYNQQGRYGADAFGAGAPPQKGYDAFSSQLYPQGQGEYPAASQAPGQSAQPAHLQAGGYSQGPSDYGSQYGSEHTRGAYSNYYGNQQGGATSQQENVAPQRATSGFGAGDSGFGGQSSQGASRYGEGQVSGNNTPNPPPGTQQHMGSHGSQSQMHQQGHSQSGYGGHHYGGPYYGQSGYYGQYANHGYPNHYYGGQGYGGGGYGAKGGMYGGSHGGYGMPGQAPYDHASSPANTGGFSGSSLQGRESSMSSNLNEYSRTGSTQPSQSTHATTPAGFGSMGGEAYGRSTSGFGSHSQSYGQQASGSGDEPLKTLHDTKSGTSPALGQSAGRPGSGFNSAGQASNQSGYGPPQGQQSGFGGGASGGYGGPGSLNQLQGNYGSSHGSLGGLGGHHGSAQGQQGGGYGGGYGGGFSNTYGNYGGRGGWGNQYSGHQYGN